MWHPDDLITDKDLLAYESDILASFDKVDWADKRKKAIYDWLFLLLKSEGYDPTRFRTRHEPSTVWGYTSSSYTDLTAASTNEDTNDINLETVLASGSDCFLVGSTKPFYGLSLRTLDDVTSVANVLTVEYWNDAWTPLVVTDRTQGTVGKSFSKGGSILWPEPTEWVRRSINSEDEEYFYVRLKTSATPTGAKLSQIGCIRKSVMCAPVTFRTLALIMREAPTSSAGPWEQKAIWYEKEADAALQRALPSIAGEFDSDDSDQISPTEAVQTPASVGGSWRIGRA